MVESIKLMVWGAHPWLLFTVKYGTGLGETMIVWVPTIGPVWEFLNSTMYVPGAIKVFEGVLKLEEAPSLKFQKNEAVPDGAVKFTVKGAQPSFTDAVWASVKEMNIKNTKIRDSKFFKIIISIS